MNKLKKGVSLVTVLLFMMVATIAATATYKWLSSVGGSSAARLELSEARMAAKAGIDAARSWMSFNGNDVGALIEQYFENSKKPIFLNPVLPRLTSSKMRDSVWLVGVNTEKSNYKLKILSVGMTRDNAKYSEMAVFNVSGLYQVRIPSKTQPLNYKEAFHGGLTTAGVIDVDAAVVKQTPSVKNAGGQGLNQIKATEYLVLDGNFYVNKEGNIEDLYVTGDLAFGNSLNVSGKLYVGGPLYGTASSNQMTVSGTAYLKGGMRPNERPNYIAANVAPIGGKFVFKSNVTSGTIEHLRCNSDFENERGFILMENNLVLNGRLIFPNNIFTNCDNSDSLRVKGNVYISENSAQGKVEFKHIRKTFFGSSSEHRIYVNGFSTLGVPSDVCGDNGVYKCAKAGTTSDNMVHFAYMGSLTASITDDEKQKWGADSLKKYYDKISQKDAEGVVQDPIQFNSALLNSRFVHSSSNPRGCSEDIWKADMDNPVELLNACYSQAEQSDNLYDNSWLVVEFTSAPEWKKPVLGKLSHNFIFIVNSSSAPTREWELPETTEEGQVFLYLPNGWPNTGTDKGIITSNSVPNPKYNYFIYSEGNIGHFHTKVANPIPMHGSIFLSGSKQLNSANGKDTLAIRFNQGLVEDLVNSHILCNYDGSGLCSGFSGVANASAGAADLMRSVDSYHIATAPQLTVAVESQYNSKENISRDPSDFDMIQKSAIVLPRVVYLTRDPVGRLADYYNVVALNGSKQKKSAEKMTCPSAIRSGSQLLYSSGSLLEEGVYVCSYTEDEKKKQIPLYVVVHGLKNEQVEVSFDKGSKEIVAGYSADVVLQAKESNAPITVHIAAPLSTDIPDGWSFAPANAGGTLTKLESTANNDVYSFTYTPDGSDMRVFTVTTETYADLSTMTFQFADDFCENCTVKPPEWSTLYISNRVKVSRSNFGSDLCSNPDRAAKFKSDYMQECSDVITWPSCEPIMANDPEWVKIKGCAYIKKNDSWNCTTDGQSVRLSNALMGEPKCQVFIPDSTLALKKADGTYILPAMIKRKQIDVRVEFKGDRGSTRAWVVYDRPSMYEGASVRDSSMCNDDDGCTIKLFAGDQVTVKREKYGSNRYNYLVCKGDDCFARDTVLASDSTHFTLGGTSSDTVEFHFGEKDKHCFYTDFDTTRAWCRNNSETDCFDYCKSGDHCTVNDGHYKNADWMIVYENKEAKLLNWDEGFFGPQLGGHVEAPSGFRISALGELLSIDTRGYRPTLALSTVRAGYNGKMTAMFEVVSVTANAWNQVFNNPIDDGFIFRSNANATEYFMMSVISKENTNPLGFWTYARICYVTSRESKKSNVCQDVPFKRGLLDNQPALMTRLSYASTNITVHDDLVTVTLHYNFGSKDIGSAIAQFDLKDKFANVIHKDEAHEYVGFKLGVPYLLQDLFNSSFKIHDIGWASETYADSCWNTPSVTCSFRANYAGGMVPKDSLVTPWVGMSSWFDGKHCDVTYFYNGCDLKDDLFVDGWNLFGISLAYGDNDLACRLTRDKGFYRWSAQKLDLYKRGKLKGDDYWFQEEGYHGYPYAPNNKQMGYVNEASVLVYCTGTGTNGHVYPASCGDFIVGTYEQCSETYEELLDEVPSYCFADTCRPELAIDSVINTRDAAIEFTITELYNGKVDVYLMDADSNYSAKAMTVNSSGDYSFEVAQYSDNGGFNPQRVVAVAFVPNGATSYRVTHIKSNCPYAFGLRCNDATYNSQSKKWRVSAEVMHPERAKECATKGLGSAYDVEELDPQSCSGFVQEIEQDGVYGQLDEREYYFTVTAYDEQGQVMDTCVTPKTTIQPLEIGCSVSETEVDRAGGIPSFSFTLSGCPADGCPYTIIYPDGSSKQGVGTSGEDICPDKGCRLYNSSDDKWSEGEYFYDVEVYGNKCLGGNMFTVMPEPPDANCTATIVDGVFKADVTFEGGANPTSWKGNFNISATGTFAFTDPMGVVLHTQAIKQSDRTFTYELPAEFQKCKAGTCHYYAVLRLHGDDTHFCSQEWDVRAAMTDASCPADISNQDPKKEIKVSPNMGGCEDGDCSWEITMNSNPVTFGSDFDGKSEISFTDANAAGKRNYKLTVSNPDGDKKECNFNVTFDNSALTATCNFTSYQLTWGSSATINIDGNCENCDYEVKSPSGNKIAEGKTNGNFLSTDVSVQVNESGTYSVYVNGSSTPTCVAEVLLPNLGTQTCSFPKSLSSNGTGKLTATISECSEGECSWSYVLKKGDQQVSTGTTGRNVEIDITTGPGSYALYLNGQTSSACEGTIEKKNDCYIKDKKSSYKYGESFTFVVNEFTKERGDYYLTDPFGNNVGSKVHCGKHSPCDNGTYNIQDAKATSSGVYKFAAKSEDCSDDIVIAPRSLECVTKKSGNSCYLEVFPSGCDYGCKVKYVGAADPHGPVDVTNSMKTIYGSSGNSASLSCASYWKVYFDGEEGSTIDCNRDQLPPSPKLISCTKKKWKEGKNSRYLEIKAENCEGGCTLNLKRQDNGYTWTESITNSGTVTGLGGQNYDVWLNDGVKMSCN